MYLSIFSSLLPQDGGAGLQAQVLHILGAAVARVRCSGVIDPHRGTGGTTGDLHRGPNGPSTAELLTSTDQTSMADLMMRQTQVAGAHSP